jgi:serine acetyltransferase
VTKEVPEGVTAVGNPARYIFKEKDKEKMLKKHVAVTMLNKSVSNRMQHLRIKLTRF